MGLFDALIIGPDVRYRARRAREAHAREVQDDREREALDLKRREVEALEKIAAQKS